MAAKSPESLAVDLFDKRLIGFAKTDEPVWYGQKDGFVRLDGKQLSPTYINLRDVATLSVGLPKLQAEHQITLRHRIIDTYSFVMDESDLRYDHLVGLPNAMMSLGPMIGLRRNESVLSFIDKAETRANAKIIDGGYIVGQSALGLAGVIRDSADVMEPIKKIRSKGLRVSELAALIDRQEGAVQELGAKGLTVHSALTIGGITAFLKANRRINDQQVNWTAEYYQKLIDQKIIDQMPPEIAGLI